MAEAYIRVSYFSIEKPFVIEAREAHCGGTEHWTIAYLSESNARILVANGLGWRHGDEPDWEKHYSHIALMRAEKDKRDAETRIIGLKEKSNG